MGRYYHSGIPDFDRIMTGWCNDRTVSIDKRDQHILLKLQIHQWLTRFIGYFITLLFMERVFDLART